MYQTPVRFQSDYIAQMRPQDILMPVAAGLCCKPGSFHIDPVRPVERALITHGHSDHARPGHGAVLATQETLDMMRLRYGDNFAGSTQAIAYGETVKLSDVSVTFHPAGHVLGSAQIAVTAWQNLHRRIGRLQGHSGSDLRSVRGRALRRVHHRGDLRPTGVPPWRSDRPKSKSCSRR
jgi:L-ascorbate metabolism protein UlaG (beta-lactamase superfamily)